MARNKPNLINRALSKVGQTVDKATAVGMMEATGGFLFRAAQVPFLPLTAPLGAVTGAAASVVGHFGLAGLRGASKGLQAMAGHMHRNPRAHVYYGGMAVGAGMAAYGAFRAGKWGGDRVRERHNDMANTMGLTQSLDAAYG